MKKRIILFYILSGLCLLGYSQKNEILLTQWADKSPIEKVYIHFDRDNYLAGETAWFKIYMYADFYPDTISTTIFVELLNESLNQIAIKTLPVIFGSSKGQFELPDSLTTGNYYIRAFTLTMLNHGEDFLFKRSLYITGKRNKSPVQTEEKKLKLDFFPESGNFITGFPNTIAFKITDNFGLPIERSGLIKDEKGEIIAELKTFHDGMGMFDISPVTGSRYYAELNEDPLKVKYFLPDPVISGLVFRVIPNKDGRDYEIYQRTDNPAMKAAYMIGQMQHRIVFRMEISPDKNDIAGFINTRQLHSGILQITVFNKDDLPLAERLCFINNREYLQPMELFTDTLSFSERGKNHFTLSFPDTVAGNFSLSITDPDYDAEEIRKESIVSNLLLTSDLKGYIHNPVYYFKSESDTIINALDILMMTNGWRRFKWVQLPEKSSAPLRFNDKKFISIAGNVNIRDTKKPLINNELFMLLFPLEDSLNSSMQFIQTDDKGKFRLDSMIFFGKTRFYVSDILGKKSKWLDIYTESDSINSTFGLSPFDIKNLTAPSKTKISSLVEKMAADYDEILKAKGQMLEGITIKVKKKTPIQELEERYSSGMFSGLTEKTIDLVNTNEKIYQNNIFDYIQGRVPGIRVERWGLQYSLYYRQRFSITGGAIPMALYLNEMQSDSRFIATIPANQIAMIKVYSSFFGAEGNGVGGVLAIYTKQGVDLTNSLSTSADIFQYKGYSIIKEFYSPDYGIKSTKQTDAVKDQRTTLLWQPDIFVDGDGMKIPVIFYNNDRSKKFKIITEGMTADGKFVFFEKIITPELKGF